MDLLSIARWYTAHGISVIPVKADKSKAPAHAGWRKYSGQIADDATLVEWFSGEVLLGIGAVPGPASGNLIVLDFEHYGESAYFEWLQRLPEELRQAALAVPTVITPSGGRHLWCRLPLSQPGGKLARYADKKTKIEIRGEGHQVLAPGCPAECHASGKTYEWATAPAADEPFPEIDFDLWLSFCEFAGQCNEHQPQEQPRDSGARSGMPAGAGAPGNDFNLRGSWSETGLLESGWTWCKQIEPERGYLTRPGKDSGISASMGMVSSKGRGYPYLYVWSTNTDFPEETPLSKFAVFAQLKHGGDYSAAAKELARLGYGERREFTGEGNGHASQGIDLSEFACRVNTPNGEPLHPFVNPFQASIATGDDANDRPFKWMSELDAQSETAKWIWKGYLARGGITLFSALWKSGKSTLLSHLLKSLDGSQVEFLGQAVSPSRVLYVTEEHEHIWADRRDKLLIGNHVGMACRPFKMRPTMQEWRDYLKVLTEQIGKHQFDLVVFDTLSKMWPVREENDAGQVEEALMPLWTMAQEDVSIMLVHHSRKSGGEQFVGSRGSGGLPAFCEILIEFSRASDDPRETQRILKAMGRYADTPVKLLAELVNGRYAAHGDPDDVEVRVEHREFEWKDQLREILERQGAKWRTFSEINDLLKEANGGESVRKADMLGVINLWMDGGEVERSDRSGLGGAYRYRLTSFDSEEVPAEVVPHPKSCEERLPEQL